MPVRWTVTWLDGRDVFEIKDVQPNVTIDAARFARPSAPARNIAAWSPFLKVRTDYYSHDTAVVSAIDWADLPGTPRYCVLISSFPHSASGSDACTIAPWLMTYA